MGVITGGNVAPGPSPLFIEERTITETTGAGTYTASVTVPAGAYLIDVIVHAVALWTAATSASLVVGDGGDADGFYTATDLKATDLLVGESLSFGHQGGKAGAYFSGTNTHKVGQYAAAARTISAVVTTVGASGSAGRTRLVVVYAMPSATAAGAATKA